MKPVKLAVVCCLLALAGCGDKDDAATAKNDQAAPAESSQQAATNNTGTEATQSASGAPTDNAAQDGITMNDQNAAPPSAAAPPDNAAAPPDSSAAAAAAVAPAAGGDSGASPDLTLGQNTFEGKCKVCHGTGAAGAPKLDDKANWAPRIAQGMDTLVKHALEGFKGKVGYMPPKGGFATLSDDEVKAAVAYMVSQAK